MKTHPCPCPNLNCPNHGICQDCTSRHLKKGTLNYCGFYAILPKLEEAIEAEPKSKTSKILIDMIDNQKNAYSKLMCNHGISFEEQKSLTTAKTNFSAY